VNRPAQQRRDRCRIRYREVVARRVTALAGALDVHVVVDERPWRRSPVPLRGLEGVGRRRRVASIVELVVVPLALTVLLLALRSHLALSSDLLAYLLVVVLVAVTGGLYPALVAAVASAGLANY